MAVQAYLTQSIIATTLIQARNIDSFYYPTSLNHTGFAVDGTYYINGVQQGVQTSPPSPIYASWYTEPEGNFRGELASFPSTGLVLLSKSAMTILDGSSSALNFWMQAIIQDNYAFTNNFNGNPNGWTPSGLAYADGVLSIICTPDSGNNSNIFSGEDAGNITSNMVIHFDFTADRVYLDVAVSP